MRAIPPRAVDFVARFEGLKLDAYLCPAGVWTIGFGHTGPEVHEGLRITPAKARQWLASDLMVAASKIEALIGRPRVNELSEGQWIALLSFVFNLGFNEKWQIVKHLKAGNFDGVPAQLVRFVNAGGKRLNGLVRRRAAEVELWNEDFEQEDLPSSFVREQPTPPEPEPKKPLFQSKTVITGATQALVGVSAGAAAINETIAPHAGSAPILGKIVMFLAVVMAATGVILLGIKWLEKQEAKR